MKFWILLITWLLLLFVSPTTSQVDILQGIEFETVLVDSTASFSALISLSDFQGGIWRLEGVSLEGNNRYIRTISGNNQTLIIPAAQFNDAGNYEYYITELIRTRAILTVVAPLSNTTVDEGQSAIFEAVVYPTFMEGNWSRNGLILLESTSDYTITTNDELRRLQILNVGRGDNAIYSYTVNDLVTEGSLRVRVQGEVCFSFLAYVVLDGSTSIEEVNFRRVKQALKDFVIDSIFRNSDTYFGIVVYSDNITHEINETSNERYLAQQIDAIDYPTGGTATYKGIDRAQELLEVSPLNLPKVMIVITDGTSTQPTRTSDSAKAARDSGTIMVAVGVEQSLLNIGSLIDRLRAELQAIALNLTESVDTFQDLGQKITNLTNRLCGSIVLVTSQMGDLTVLVGSEPRFVVGISRDNYTEGVWTRGALDLSTDNRYIISTDRFRQLLRIPNVQLTDAGLYLYTASQARTSGQLTVLDLLVDTEVDSGQDATFQTTVNPGDVPGRWLRNGVPLTASAKYVITDNGGLRTLRITNAVQSDAGSYTYEVNGVTTTGVLTIRAIIVDGNWSDWSGWLIDGTCSATCGNDSTVPIIRRRTCTNPPPSPGGNTCPGLAIERGTANCNLTNSCPVDGQPGNWNQWSAIICDVTCGFSQFGFRNRSRPCNSPPPSGGGRDCILPLTETGNRPCFAGNCPRDGGISPWANWGTAVCTETCGNNPLGTSTRERFCNNPPPAFGGLNCTETRTETRQAPCVTLPRCPVDGNWGPWSTWEVRCFASCGNPLAGQRSRSRLCNNPAPSPLGRGCDGSSQDINPFMCDPVTCPVNGGFGPWSDWLVTCFQSCGLDVRGSRTRNRLCNNPTPVSPGLNCTGAFRETESTICENVPECPVDGNWGNWSPWTDFCNETITCGILRSARTRNRSCDNPTPTPGIGSFCPGEAQELEPYLCPLPPCPVNGQWGGWTTWSMGSCSEPCGGGQRLYTRRRFCDSPAPRNNGTSCPGPDQDSRTEECNTDPCSIDGGYGPWSAWSENCLDTCGVNAVARLRRGRACNNPPPQFGGQNCSLLGPATETRFDTCSQFVACPVDGNWGSWSLWKPVCDRNITCGNYLGSRFRNRTCDNPARVPPGADCLGESIEADTYECRQDPCPVDGQFSAWSLWTDTGCSRPCGGGIITYTRSRLCNNPPPLFNGRSCVGNYNDTRVETCNDFSCAVNGGFSGWTNWANTTSCDVTCGRGNQRLRRERFCDNPPPSDGGLNCTGQFIQFDARQCQRPSCAVNGGYSPWSPWVNITNCPETCGRDVFRMRRSNRLCNNPPAQNGGLECPGPFAKDEQVNCGFDACPVDGGFTFWTQWSAPNCTAWTCGINRQGPAVRFRACTNPIPANGGRFCVGPFDQTANRPCNFSFCPVNGVWTLWTNWAIADSCSVSCGQGTQRYSRTRRCDGPRYNGTECPGAGIEFQPRVCNDGQCPIDGVYGGWSNWAIISSCSVTCGTGFVRRRQERLCNSPAPQNKGRACLGASTNFDTFGCFPRGCPVDGVFGPWTRWELFSSCSRTCGLGQLIERRNRSCDSPAPSNDGANCQGEESASRTRDCNPLPCPINGVWSGWSQWLPIQNCTKLCGNGTRIFVRGRTCSNPPPSNGGLVCPGSNREERTDRCNVFNCPVDGRFTTWSQWNPVGFCSRICGGGVQQYTRFRSCTNPAPAYGGQQCVGPINGTLTRGCNIQRCPINGNYGSWYPWESLTSCSVVCGFGQQTFRRKRDCNRPPPQFDGRNCTGNSEETVARSCDAGDCPVDGGYGLWTPWVQMQGCSRTCGGGFQPFTRNRQCDRPPRANGGNPCDGPADGFITRDCNTNPCPINGGFTDWTDWVRLGTCTRSCDGGSQRFTRTRQCTNPVPRFNGTSCVGPVSGEITRICNTDRCPIHGFYENWYPWIPSTQCSVTCGSGSQNYVRSRYCSEPLFGGRPCIGESNQTTSRPCDAGRCPIDGGLSDWTSWTRIEACTATCQGGVERYRRTRQCNNPVPQFNGRPCTGITDDFNITLCATNPCPIDGAYSGWSAWTAFGICTVTCGGGNRPATRTRVCDNPRPQFNGSNCQGRSSEATVLGCNNQSCPINGGFTLWAPWIDSGCSPTCGRGVVRYLYRNRTCTNPAPAFNGNPCFGDTYNIQIRNCNIAPCPVNGNWSPWTSWSAPNCTNTCGPLLRVGVTRQRFCNNPEPANGGLTCPGEDVQVDRTDCDRPLCPINGGPSPWAAWVSGNCSVTCGTGSRQYTRQRTCTNPLPRYNGAFCRELLSGSETRTCFDRPCPVDGRFTPWSQWTGLPCLVTCGRDIRRNITRSRSCTAPAPQNNGAPCVGDTFQSVLQPCNVSNCPVDGGISLWTRWYPGTCSRTCGDGTRTDSRFRFCNNPYPQFEGRNCTENRVERRANSCKERDCPIDGGFTLWGPWDNPQCSVTCGGGTRVLRRSRTCSSPIPQFGGEICIGNRTSSEIRSCNPQLCPINGGFSPWTEWNIPPCPTQCGTTAIRTLNRTRVCNNPVPQNNGRPCTGTTFDTTQRICILDGCPVNGQWSQWIPWANLSCNPICGNNRRSFRYRLRVCNDPPAANGGNYCPGRGYETQFASCPANPCPVNGQWTPWTNWIPRPCTISCGVENTQASRTRSCTNPSPAFGGSSCPGLPAQSRTQKCDIPLCRVNGAPGPWDPWTIPRCEKSCGTPTDGAYVYRRRRCDSPAPANGGRDCQEPLFQSRMVSCNYSECPVNGNWGDWAPWTDPVCNAACGPLLSGTVERSRLCNNPAPRSGGNSCPGLFRETGTKLCGLPNCPINGQWSPWGTWQIPNCPVRCGGWTRTLRRERLCNSPAPRFGGLPCPGNSSDSQTERCNIDPCPINGVWSEWSPYTPPRCGVTCGSPSLSALVERTRVCDNPIPQFGGLSCPGLSRESRNQSCNLQPCAINGGFSPWGVWSPPICLVSCGINQFGNSIRTRACNNPAPANGGDDCDGPLIENGQQRCTNLTGCPVDGAWSAWGPWSDPGCPSCGTLAARDVFRQRFCDSPAPAFNGNSCPGPEREIRRLNCNLRHCPGDVEGLCQNVINLRGVGYRRHPEDCDKYIQCYFNTTNDVVAVFHSCPFGHYWDQEVHRCDLSWKVTCPQEKCTDDCAPTYDMDGSCQAYWVCENGRSVAQCCGVGNRYIPSRGCVADPFCTEPCPPGCLNTLEACDKQPEWNTRSLFNIQAGSLGWVRGTCPVGQVYDIVQCECVPSTSDFCQPRVSFDFSQTNPPVWEISGVQILVNPGIGNFNGNSQVIYPNSMSASVLTLRFRYRERNVLTGRQVLATSNECLRCTNASSILITLEPNKFNFDLMTFMGGVVRVNINTEGFAASSWKDVSILYRDSSVTVVIKSDEYEYVNREWAPQVEILTCGIRFGSDTSATPNFQGDIDYIYQYQCEPNDLY